MSDLTLPALDFIAFGTPVLDEDGGCRGSASLVSIAGVARRPRGRADMGYAAGEPVTIARDGGILAIPLADAEVEVRGVTMRLLAGEKHYLHLQNGRVIGFQGDGGPR